MASVTERLELLIDAKAGGAISELRKLNAEVDKTSGVQQQATGVTAKFEAGMQRLGLSTGVASTVLKTAVPVAAATAGAALVKFGSDAVHATTRWADGIRLVQQATGASAETSSRLVAIMDDFGISAEKGATSLAKFGTNAANHKAALAEDGIEIVKAKDGTIDLVATLENAADAYKNAGSGAERDKLLLDAFGKSGRDLIPILEKGSAGIKEMFGNVPQGQIFSQAQIDQAREFELAMDNLQDSIDEVKFAVGNALIPTLAAAADSFATTVRGANAAARPLGGLGASANFLFQQINPLAPGLHAVAGAQELWNGNIRQGAEDLTRAIPGVGNYAAGLGTLTGIFHKGSESSNELLDAQKRLAAAQKDLSAKAADSTTSHKDLAAAQKEVTAAGAALEPIQQRVVKAFADTASEAANAKTPTEDYATSVQHVTDAQWRMYESSLALSNATLGVEGAALNTESALNTYNQAIFTGGVNSLEARQAHNRLEESVLAEAAAAAEADKKQRELAGGTQTAEQATEAQRGELERMKQKFPELTPIIDGYISKLDDIQNNIETTLSLQVKIARIQATVGVDENGEPVLLTFGSGGVVPGPVGAPTPAIVHGGETVFTPEQLRALGNVWGDVGSASSTPITIGTIVSPRPEDVPVEIARRRRVDMWLAGR